MPCVPLCPAPQGTSLGEGRASSTDWRQWILRASAHSWGTAGTGVHGSHGGVRAEAGGGHLLASGMSMSPLPTGPGAGWGPVLTLGTGGGTQELLAGFSLLGELEEDDDEEEEKLTAVRPGGLVAVFCPVRLFRQTGQLSCCSSQGTMQPSWKRWLQGSCRTRSPSS